MNKTVKAIRCIADLKSYPQWVCYNKEKVPFSATGTPAEANAPETWSSFDEAWKAARASTRYKGVGFEFIKEQGLTGIDLDHCVDQDGNLSEFAQKIVNTLDSYTEYSPSGSGLHIWTLASIPKTIASDTNKDNPNRLEMYDKGHYLTVTGKHLAGTPETIEERQAAVTALYEEETARRKQGKLQKENTGNTISSFSADKSSTPYGLAALSKECSELASAGQGSRNSKLNAAAYSLGQLIAGNELARETVERELTLAAQSCGLEDREIEKTMRSGLDSGLLNPRSATGEQPQKPFNLTDLGNAERFARRYKDTVRWCETWSSWMVFNGRCWEQDKIGRVDQLAKIVVRSIYTEAAKTEDEDLRKKIAKHAAASESNRSVRAMLDRAKSELPATPDDFNKQLYLLNCENGTLDLRTKELRPHNPQDMLTRCLKISYNPLAESPRWTAFISKILGDDIALIQFMQQALGMSLCGDTSEQCLFICHGMGSNGKTTMLETVRIIMASYACAANIETFQMRKAETIGNDIAELYGARLVTASETKLGGRLNEAFVKKATGKEPLRARRLHENEFEFMPEFTLWLAVNHKPVVLDTSKGMWRRVHFIPFNVTIEGDAIDKHFGDKLLEEAEGILAWLVQGCYDWFKQGHLNVPDAVREATAGYRAEMDIVANFLQDECVLQQGAKVSTKQLIERFEEWCGHNSEKFDAKILKNSLKERGLHSQRGTGGAYYWQDIGLKAASTSADDSFLSEHSEGTENELSSNSEGSEGSERKNRVNLKFKNPPDATLNSRSLPSLPSLPTSEAVIKETISTLLRQVTAMQTPSVEWPRMANCIYEPGRISFAECQRRINAMIAAGDDLHTTVAVLKRLKAQVQA